MPNRPKPVVLCILDGWGNNESIEHNAIKGAHIPNWNRFEKTYPCSELGTSGLDVGLPEGQMGNSEVGHMNIGSGRIVMQTLPKIDQSIKDGSFSKNPALISAIEKLKRNGGDFHIMGLISDGGVHSHIDHIIELAETISHYKVPIAIHAFTDGRDTAPSSAIGFIKTLEKNLHGLNNVKICTVSGRYYSMDRDNRWERIEMAYNAIVLGLGKKAANPVEAIEESYNEKKTDEFITPYLIGNYKGMKDGDAIIMANFRADRVRQIMSALILPDFKDFPRKSTIKFGSKIGMVEYSDTLSKFQNTIFRSEPLNNILGQVVSDNGLKQLRIAETEKYAHVTFFFNGGMEQVFPGEDRILIPSPKVATYDLKPEMSSVEVTDRLVKAVESDKYDLIVVNYANTDMVGHTGDYNAAKKAVEAVDKALGRLEKVILEKNGVMLITADHGNAEIMIDKETGDPHTSHTLNPVPFIVIGAGNNIMLHSGKLCDIAPTILKLMGIKQPIEMTGKSLIS